MNHSLYAAVILSAGLSSRMPHFKPLLKIDGIALIDRVMSLFFRDNIDVYIVTGHRQGELKAHILNPDITLVENPDYLKGMFSSVRAGVSQLREGYKAFYILPLDIPLIRPYTISRMLETSKSNPGKIIYPVFNGKRGHPPLIPAGIIPAILESSGEGGLKSVLERFEENAIEIKVPDRFILKDIDTLADYEDTCRNLSSYNIPTEKECEAIFDICEVDIARRLHCYKVAEISVSIGLALLKNGHKLNLELVRAASILHDIAKKQPQHDIAGSLILRKMGFDRVADIVAVHTFLDGVIPVNALEASIVYLADKLVQGDKLVSLNERFDNSFRRFNVNSEIENKIRERKQRALAVKKELEDLIGLPLESIIY